MGAPESYREQHGCRDCIHRFEHHDYDAYVMIYCTLNAPPRPKCGSMMMEESFGLVPPAREGARGSYSDKVADREFQAWEEWSQDRCVSHFGICDEWKLED